MTAWALGAFAVAFIPVYAYGFDWKWGRAIVMWVACVAGGWLAWVVISGMTGL